MKRLFNSIAIATTLIVTGCGVIDYSEGDRAGQIVKFSNKGLFCKTWEGEMVLGGVKSYSSTSTDSQGQTTTNSYLGANVFEFTVTDPAIVTAIQQKMESGERAIVHYKQAFLPNPCTQGTEFVVVQVK